MMMTIKGIVFSKQLFDTWHSKFPDAIFWSELNPPEVGENCNFYLLVQYVDDLLEELCLMVWKGYSFSSIFQICKIFLQCLTHMLI